MSRACRVAARASEALQATPRSPAPVRARFTRQPRAKRRARAPDRRRAPGHGCEAGTATGSETASDGTAGTLGTAGTGTGSDVCAAAADGTRISAPTAAPSAARVDDVPLL